MTIQNKYSVVVGNIGTVWETDNYFDACKVYGEYKQISLSGIGRAGGEDVALFDGEELLFDHSA